MRDLPVGVVSTTVCLTERMGHGVQAWRLDDSMGYEIGCNRGRDARGPGRARQCRRRASAGARPPVRRLDPGHPTAAQIGDPTFAAKMTVKR